MTEQRMKLDDWLDAARADLAERAPSALAEQQLLTRAREAWALQSIAATRMVTPVRTLREGNAPDKGAAGRWRLWSFRLPVALAAAIMLGIGVVVYAPVAPDDTPVGRSPFFALVAPEAMATERAAVVVDSQVSGAALADYGLPVDPARVDEPIAAQFLLSPAGVVLAVRFIE
jgi:hypothetical protein